MEKFSNIVNFKQDKFHHLFLLPSILIAMVVVGGLLRSVSHHGFVDWIPFLLAGPSVVIAFLSYKKIFYSPEIGIVKANNYWYLRLFYYVASLILIGVIYQTVKIAWDSDLNYSLISFIVATNIAISILVYRYINKNDFIKYNNLFLYMVFIVSLEAWCGLFRFTNWASFFNAWNQFPVKTVIVAGAGVILLTMFVFQHEIDLIRKRSLNINLTHGEKRTGFIISMLTIVFVAISFWISFRYDTLFTGKMGPSSIWHWRYFVDPVQTVKNGGWLLWNTPSLYGYFNILIAAMIPAKTAWQAIYLLQGMLFFLASLIMYKILTYNAKSILRVSLVSLLIFSSLYFSFNDTTGAYLWPSVGVMRFIGCYIFLFLNFIYWKNDNFTLNKFMYYGSVLWVFFVLWSAESAIYCSFTFYLPLLIMIFQQVIGKKINFKKALFFSAFPAMLLIATMLTISIYYLLNIKHFPDWLMYIEYGFWCAAGFTHLPLDSFGPAWLALLLFIGFLLYMVDVAIHNPMDRSIAILCGLAGCVYASTSYYFSRSAPGYIAAVFPIWLTIIGLGIHIANRHANNYFSPLVMKVVAIPVCFSIFVSTLANPDLLKNLAHFKSFSSDVTRQQPAIENDLKAFLMPINISANEPVMYDFGYYGYDTQLMRNRNWVDKETWLPSPIYTFMQPVPKARKALVLKRFVSQMSKGGYVIHLKGFSEEFFVNWQKLVSAFFNSDQVYQNDKWLVVHYTPKKEFTSEEEFLQSTSSIF